ncbi:putative ABC transporter permease protein [Flavihumibacter petaseus NBRC 106054]|uniref:Putative ABC transporter permease protein n=2 Tax=Flavihumibacter TaxID=1004301 RepID=A0A0E9MWV9_9BACT|nr:putative ABC transporter permease protein [Flavihumibacter petaseus NBRC 106054]
MIQHFFRVGLRQLRHNKTFSGINIVGLAMGLATCFMILLYILDESSYDTRHESGNRVYRIYSDNSKGETWAASAAPVAAAIKGGMPEVEKAARILTFPDISTMLVSHEQSGIKKQFFETNGYYVDAEFFEIFTYRFLYGTPATSLQQPNSVVISSTMADKFFPVNNGQPVNPIGKTLTIQTPFGPFAYVVTGVFDPAFQKSHLPANYFLSMQNGDMSQWVDQQTSFIGNNVFHTYVKLKDQSDFQKTGEKINALFQAKAGGSMKAAGFWQRLRLQAMPDIYLHSAMPNELMANGDIQSLYILGSIGLFLMLIACVNFVNLSTARSERRAREVGLRKVMGAGRVSLIRQFLAESMVVSMLSLVIAVVAVQFLLPLFNQLTGKGIRISDQYAAIGWMVLLTVTTGFLAGCYPAFYLSSFRPIGTLKGRLLAGFTATAIRRGLVVFQFTVSACLILAAIVIHHQLSYVRSQSLGFRQQQQLIIPLQKSYLNSEDNYQTLRNALLQLPEITSVTSASAYPGATNLNDMLFFPEGKTAADNVDIHLAAVEENYIETLGIQLVAGRSFSKDFHLDSSSIIVNEAAVKQLGFTSQQAIGKTIRYDVNNNKGAMTIVGVVRNFHYESLHHTIRPFGFTTESFGNRFGFCIASLSTTNYSNLLKKIGSKWLALHPDVPFDFSFLDQQFYKHYAKEQKTASLINYFTLIAIVIACLGLLGLAAFSVEQRTREIGVRKVLGATTFQVTSLLSKDFVYLVAVSLLLAGPLSWWAMKRWLQAFVYRVDLEWWMFAIAGSIALFAAIVTIGSQAIRIAWINPARSLRSE